MNTFEFKSLFDLLQAFPTEQSCIEYLELCRWKNGIVSPYDPASKVYNYGGGNGDKDREIVYVVRIQD